MFAFLLNVYRGFVGLFDGIEFNGTSILLWGMVPFILTAVVRFVLPLLHIPVGFGIINRAGSVVSSAPEYYSNRNTVVVNRNMSNPTSSSGRNYGSSRPGYRNTGNFGGSWGV